MYRRIVNSNQVSTSFFRGFVKKFHKQLHADMSALVLGAGRHRHSRYLYQSGMRNVVSIDKIPCLGDLPRGVKFIKHDLEKGMHFVADRSVDVLVCIYVLEFIQNRDMLFAELNRTAKAGSVLVLLINPKPLKNGYPINLDACVEELCANEKWDKLTTICRSTQRGYVLQKKG